MGISAVKSVSVETKPLDGGMIQSGAAPTAPAVKYLGLVCHVLVESLITSVTPAMMEPVMIGQTINTGTMMALPALMCSVNQNYSVLVTWRCVVE